MLLALIIWVAIGAIVGFAASKMVDLHGDAPMFGIGAAVLGSIVAGMACGWFGNAARAAWGPRALFASGIAAAAAVAIWHAVRSRTISHDRPTVRRSY